MCHASDTAEHRSLHEVVRVRPKTIDDVVVIPDVELWDLAIGAGKRLGAVPLDVIVVVVLVALRAHCLIKRIFAPLASAVDFRPGLQRPICADAVVVDLISTSDHDMERLLRVNSQNIIPKRWSLPDVHIGTDREPVTRMEHYAHTFVLGGNEKTQWFVRIIPCCCSGLYHLRNRILPTRFPLLIRRLDLPAPELFAWIRVQLLRFEGVAERIVSRTTGALELKRCRLLTGSGDNHDTAVPHGIWTMFAAHVSVVQQWTANDLELPSRALHTWTAAHSLLMRRDARIVRCTSVTVRLCLIAVVVCAV